VAQVSPTAGWMYQLNPLALLLEGYRTVTYHAAAPEPESILMPIGTGLVLIVPATVLFSVLQPRFAKRL
jgi:ABC-type polysaccharide/polyol phosphate export permease